MNHPKTEHKVRKYQSHARHENVSPAVSPSTFAPSPSPTGQASGTIGMMEACDRLGQKLDEFAEVLRERLTVWRQIPPDDVPRPTRREKADHRPLEAPVNEPAPAPAENPSSQPEEPSLEAPKSPEVRQLPAPSVQPQVDTSHPASILPATTHRQEPMQSAPTLTPTNEAIGALAERANNLIDALAQKDGGWQDQVTRLGQALETIMVYLENQSPAVAPKVDVRGIMDRLRALEDRQQSLQSQFNINR